MLSAVVPAAGLGTRLGAEMPKALVELNGRSLLGHVLDAVGPSVDGLVLVVRPGTEELFAGELRRLAWDKPVRLALQEEPSGSADAVALGLGVLPPDEPCTVVWADHVGVSAGTVSRVTSALRAGFSGLVLPLVEVERPYVWFSGGPSDLRVGRRRDGDVVPRRGLNDVGTFGLIPGAGLTSIEAAFGPQPVRDGRRERDFVYVLPVLARLYGLRTVEVENPSEAIGVNDHDDMARAEHELWSYAV